MNYLCYNSPMNLAENKKAMFDCEILEKYEAGLALTGQEVKSAKSGQINLKGSYVTFHNGKAYVLNMHINKYKPAGPLPNYDPTRSRQLLLRKKEIAYLQEKSMEKGLTIMPLRVYTKQRLIKMEIGIGRGRKTYDKREVIKKRDVKREIARAKKN
jgi:SsrA-binding protein